MCFLSCFWLFPVVRLFKIEKFARCARQKHRSDIRDDDKSKFRQTGTQIEKLTATNKIRLRLEISTDRYRDLTPHFRTSKTI